MLDSAFPHWVQSQEGHLLMSLEDHSKLKLL